ncbi:uncharacterized protein LOC121373980 [Gigantopelta aegis]|uniref:uncharacterized protein LOC121373980 n=1 Tax=Gigantopelta aegis TaxID=1735272 RepID=UPI001B88E77E|nr:uncharacterized protein LOC121373980 [Gigantopelta aegis]
MTHPMNVTILKTLGLLTFTGINGIKNIILDTHSQETVVATQSVHTLVLDKPLAITNEAEFRPAIQKVWSSVLGEEVTVILGPSKEYIMQHGKPVWKLEYFLQINATTLKTNMIPRLNSSQKLSLDQMIATVSSPRGGKYAVIKEQSLREYAMHFPLYFTSKVAQKDMAKIKEEIRKAWSNSTGENVSNIAVDITSQKEMLDQHGRSVWKLAYFLKKDGKPVDSRVIEFRNVTKVLKLKLSQLNDIRDWLSTC